jgi:molecular chaperone HscB
VQPPDDGADLFSVLGQPARFAVDLATAETAYKDLSRQVHPDRFAKADPQARRAALARTVQLNEAWRTIKDPVRRAEYLLLRAGIDVGEKKPSPGDEAKATHRVAAPPAFLIEILELNDELSAAKRAGDAVKVAFMAEEMRSRARATMKTIGEALDGGTGRLEDAARSLVALRYFQRFIDQASAEGGGGAL